MDHVTEIATETGADRAPAVRTILVAGGAGFLGSHLCERLLDRGNTVVCLDDYSTGAPGNVAHLREHERFRVVHHDVTEPPPPDLPTFDDVYNLACPASPVHYQRDPLKTALTSALGAWRLTMLARRDCARVFHASTSEVYGDPHVHPQPESYHGNVNPVGPRACYDEGKRFAETLLTDFGAVTGLPVRIARIFNTYGPRMCPNDGRVVSNFIVQALRDEDLTIFGDGSQTRSFCYVDDLIDGFEALMRLRGGSRSPVNLGNPAEISVLELAKTVIDMTGSRARIRRLPLPVDDPRRRRPDIGLARATLGWEPKVGLREGLDATIRYFEARLSAGSRADAAAALA